MKASMIGNNVYRYEGYLNEVLAVIKNASNRGVTFE